MTCLLHVSDPHFGTETEPLVEAVLRLSASIDPDLVLLGGDITQRARAAQFAAARRFVRCLGKPVLAVPGNHDMPLFNLAARLLDPYGGYRRALGAILEPTYEDQDLLVLGVNTTRPSLRVGGRVSDAQIRRVAQRLSQAKPKQLRIVLLHHPVRAIEASDRVNLLDGREAAVPAWLDAGVDLILGGHIHLPYVVPLSPAGQPPGATGGTPSGHGIPCGQQDDIVPPGSGQATAAHGWAVQAGTAVSRRVRGGIPNSVNAIRHRCVAGAHHCEVERWDFDGAGFVRAQATPLHWRR